MTAVDLTKKDCSRCKKKLLPLTPEQAKEQLAGLHEWSLVDGGHLLTKHFVFSSFKQTMRFVNAVAALAEEQGHHPDMAVSYGNVSVELTTHDVGGLSENDFILAAKIDHIPEE